MRDTVESSESVSLMMGVRSRIGARMWRSPLFSCRVSCRHPPPVVVEQGHGDVGGGAAVVSVGGGGLEVGGHVRNLGAGGHGGGRGEAAAELLLHGAGQQIDITEGEVAIGAIHIAENENV